MGEVVLSRSVCRTVISSLALAGLAWSGCSSDGPTKPHAPRISDSGTLVEVHEYADGKIKEYDFQGTTFFGDMLVSEYEYALSIIEPRYSEGEVLLSVSNCRVFPPSQTNEGYAPADGFALRTCTADTVEFCNDGLLYVFKPTLDGFGLAPIMWWHIFH
jgi:hypothetical protein